MSLRGCFEGHKFQDDIILSKCLDIKTTFCVISREFFFASNISFTCLSLFSKDFVFIFFSEGYSSEDDESFEGLIENKLAQQMLNDSKINPIAHYQTLWGMNDVALKFTPEALEIIANQATQQNAGHAGIAAILEKLFLNIKFDILGSDIASVEINEDAVLGKKRPSYVRRNGRKKSPPLASNLCAIEEEMFEDNNSDRAVKQKVPKVHRTRVAIPSRLTEYDMAICESIEF